jgi:basic membrane protein A
MKKHQKLSVLFALLIVMVLVVAACKSEATEAPDVEEKTRVAVVFPGVVSDQSWNEFGYEGLTRAEKECGVEIAYTEDVFPDEQVEVIRNYAAEGYDVIIGHGGEYADAISQVAAEYPDIWFGDTNGLPEGDNVSIMIIGYNQMSYLAGVLACEMTDTNHVAVVGAMDIPVMIAAYGSFVEGVEYCSDYLGKDIEVDEVYTGDWADVTLAREATLALIADGADVIYHHLDAADAGMIAAAEDSGVWAIGLYRDSRELGPDAVIGSAIGFPGEMIYRLACGKVPKGEKQYLNVHTGVDINMTDLVPQEVQDRVNGVVEKMKSGELVIKMFGEE